MKSKLSNITVQNCRTDVVYEISANDPDFETKFQRNNLNRLIAKNHVSEIRSSITDSSWEMFSPIEVNINTWNVIDGQHRLDAFSTLSDDIKKNAYLRVIFYKLKPEDEIELIKSKNTKNKNWTVKVFAESNMRSGKCKELTMLYDFCKNHPKCRRNKKGGPGSENLGYGSAFLWGTTPTKALKSGKFTGAYSINANTVKFADELYKEVDKMLEAFDWEKTATWYERFAQAWRHVRTTPGDVERFKDIGLNNVITNLKADLIPLTTDRDEWITWFERIGLGL